MGEIAVWIAVFIILTGILKAAWEFIEAWIDMLFSRFMEYRYAIFFAYSSDKTHGFGRTEMISPRVVDSISELFEMEGIIRDDRGEGQVCITSILLMQKNNRVFSIVGSAIWVCIKTVTEGVRLSFTRSADDALNEYIEAHK